MRKDDSIHIIWHVDDILNRYQDILTSGYVKDVGLTYEDAKWILHHLDYSHDCNFGINWDVIDVAIEDYIKKFKEDKSDWISKKITI